VDVHSHVSAESSAAAEAYYIPFVATFGERDEPVVESRTGILHIVTQTPKRLGLSAAELISGTVVASNPTIN
jgi:hypothetical protein